jgi:hypothetical protein
MAVPAIKCPRQNRKGLSTPNHHMITSMLLIACIFIGRLSNVVAGDGQVVQQISANGQKYLSPFAVTDKWEIRWDSKGSLLNVTIYRANGQISGIGGRQEGPGSGSSYQPKGGYYYLEVSGTGEWTVSVVQLP